MIPVYSALLDGNEKQYLSRAITSGWVSSDGFYVQLLEEAFAKWTGNDYAVAVNSGTAALETALWACGVRGGRVTLTTSTIISCAIAILRVGAEPDFQDIYLHGFYGKSLAEAIMPVHLFGHYQEAQQDKLLVEDCSQYWTPFRVKDVACYSLYANKLITAGEGGIIVTNKKEIYDRARAYRNLCHSEERFIHNEIGYNFRMSHMQAAVALAQLEQIDRFVDIKRRNKEIYLQYLPQEATPLFDVDVPWMYLIKTPLRAEIVVKKLKEAGIDSRRFFYPLHKQPCFKGKYEHLHLPSSEIAWDRWLYLPSGLTLTKEEIQQICLSLKNILSTTR